MEKKKRHKITTIKSKDTRVLNISMGNDGKGSLSAKLSIPKIWLDFLGITKEERQVSVTLNPRTKKITIVKCQDNEIVEDEEE